jgi:V8-like Glu-specific endopeptidase
MRLLRQYAAFVIVAAAAVVAAAMLTAGSASADSSTVTHIYSSTAQDAAASYWTPSALADAAGLSASSNALDSTNPPPGIPDPVYFDGVPTVGALFFTTGTQNHFCTASVTDSLTRDLVLTAAHCVAYSGGTYAQNVVYVPEWHNGVAPYGAWPVQNITVTSSWEQSRDVNADFAFLRVAPPAGTHRQIQSVTGGLQLGSYTGYQHRHISVIGYNNTDSAPIICATSSFYAMPSQEEFYCNNYNDGTSGGPWILGLNRVTGTGVVFGDIGGYEEGGNYPWASYSAYYDATIARLWAQAQLSQL